MPFHLPTMDWAPQVFSKEKQKNIQPVSNIFFHMLNGVELGFVNKMRFPEMIKRGDVGILLFQGMAKKDRRPINLFQSSFLAVSL